jgi:hypothetical protein
MSTRQKVWTRLAVAGTLVVCAVTVSALAAAADTGHADAAGAVPRFADGHPDLSGTWDNGSGIDFVHPEKSSDGSVCVAGCPPAPPATAQPTSTRTPPPPAAARTSPQPDVPRYRPELMKKVHDLDKNQVRMDPVLRCKNPGLPRIGPPDKIVQTRNQMVFLYDDVSGAFWRIVPTDGRPHRTDVDDSYLGDSVGHWEGDTLVIDASHFNDDSWLTDNGAFHSTALHVTERFHRVGDTIDYEATVEDPKVLAEPWKRHRTLKLTDVELAEPAPCIDQDLKHLVDDSHHPNPR